MRAGRYRPAYVHRLRAGLDANGNVIAWHNHIVGQSILAGTPFENGAAIDPTSVEGASKLPYAFPNVKVELTTTAVGVPVLWWRSVGSTHTAYAVEAFIDEVAEAAGKDPIAFRLAFIKDHPRHVAALKLAAEKARWGEALPAGRFRGVAVAESSALSSRRSLKSRSTTASRKCTASSAPSIAALPSIRTMSGRRWRVASGLASAPSSNRS
jgi:isoquinoline 1-oxidoreductase beta subunit